ncbi:MAG TPA: membrane protein insertion efficiency factor YidD [Methylibium sp.]|nr:membrane protein insertion efficiency factor YidD [Methylibium sp.]
MKPLAIAAIRLYRRWLSPLKGRACAYRVHTGRPSCSRLAERAIRRHGVIGGIGVLQHRLACCGEAWQAAHGERPVPASQRGSCDVPCDIPCDGSELSGCDCGDCGSERRQRRERRSRA